MQKADNVTVEPLGEKNEVIIITKELEYKLELEHLKTFSFNFPLQGAGCRPSSNSLQVSTGRNSSRRSKFFLKSNICQLPLWQILEFLVRVVVVFCRVEGHQKQQPSTNRTLSLVPVPTKVKISWSGFWQSLEGSPSQFSFEPFLLCSFSPGLQVARLRKCWVKIFNVKMVKTKFSEGPPKLCQNSKSVRILSN